MNSPPFSCKPYYMTDEDQLYSHIPNCTEIAKVKALNKALDVEQTFSDFKKYHKKPCYNFALTYQKKIKVFFYGAKLINGIQ